MFDIGSLSSFDGVARRRRLVPLHLSLEALEAREMPATGLVAAYNFNEGKGSVLTDLSGNGNNGTVSNATWSAAGKNGGALSFNGTSSMVTVPGSTSLNLSKGMTLEAWVNASSLSDWRSVLLKERTNGLSYSLYATDPYNSPSGPSAFINTGGSDQSAASSTALATNTWTHLAATYDGSTLRFYVNGTLKASQKVSGSLVTSSGALRIGGNTVWGEYFKGSIDDVRVYNQALTQSAIQSDMNTAVGSSSGTTSPATSSPPTASAGPDQAANEGAKVTFQGSGTGTGLSYSWDFGDGSAKATTATATHAYADNGSYTATLTVTDASGQTATDTAAVTVSNVAPTATFSGPSSVAPGASATFSFASPSDPSSADTAAGFTYSYDFNNDGTFEVANSSSASASTTFANAGTYTVRGRITDKDGGFTDYTTTVNVAAPSSTTTTSLWSNSAKPTVASDPDTNAVELGVKFTSDVAGSVSGLRFYKGSGNTGTHVGHLWDASGNLLATVTFTGETASGWQTATFSNPVAINANTTYIVSYFAPNGHYAGDNNYFATTGVNNGVLHAPSGSNGVYRYGSTSGFPTSTYQSSNYWVDVVFSSSSGSTTTTTTPGGTPQSTSPPMANAGPAQTAAEGAKVTFNGSGTGTGLSYSWDFGDGSAKATTATATHAYADQGSYTATLTVTDSSGQTATSTAAVTVTDVAPTATFSGPSSVAPGASATFSFANPSSPSTADTAAGFLYSYDFNNDGTFEVANSISPSATTSFAAAGTYTVRGRISAQDGAFTDYTTTVTVSGSGTTNGAATYDGLTIPTSHTRLLLTPALLSQAKQYYASHPFTPASDDPYSNALAYQLTGKTSYAQTAINSLMSFTISSSELSGVASDNYRWNSWVPIVFDWVYDQMTDSQRSTFITRYNGYVSTMMQKDWGGPGMPSNNYFWGYLQNEFNWAVATYYENTTMAQKFLDDALKTRWNAFLTWANGGGAGGVPQEGTQYGRYMLDYAVSVLTTAKQLGRDLFQETNWYKQAANYLIYSTSPGAVADGNQSYAQVFPFNDDQFSLGSPAANDPNYVDFMTVFAQDAAGTTAGAYARQWLANVQGTPSWLVAAEDSGGTGQSLGSLPLDYYAPGPGYLYAKNGWSAGSTSINFMLGTLTGVGHAHLDSGSFQMLSNGQWLTKNTTGYGSDITGYNGSGTVSVGTTLATNGILVGGLGEANAYADGPAQVTRLESTPDYTFASVTLTPVYRAHASNYPQRDDNPYAGSVVRDFLFIRSLNVLLVFDRVQSTSEVTPAANVAKTFLLHFANNPTVSGNTVVGTNGNEALQLTALTPAAQPAPSFKVVNETTSSPDNSTDYQYRLEENTSGSALSYLVNVLQARGTNQAGAMASMTEDANNFTITVTDQTKGTAVITMAKSLTSTGGTFAYSASGTPTSSTALTSGVAKIQVTNNGPVWGG
jgi:PKD repeat protein